MVGALGSVLGIALALAMIWLFSNFVQRGLDGLPLFAINSAAAGCAGGFDCHCLWGVLAAIAPARSAAAMDPAQAIRL